MLYSHVGLHFRDLGDTDNKKHYELDCCGGGGSAAGGLGFGLSPGLGFGTLGNDPAAPPTSFCSAMIFCCRV